MKEESNQERHEKLIDFLNGFKQYQSEDGKPLLKKVKRTVTSDQFKNISINDINKAVVVFTDVLNLYGGSVGDVDLYSLLQAYLKVPEYRGKIDKVVSEANSFDLHRDE